MSCNAPLKTYPALGMMLDIIDSGQYGYPQKYGTTLDHGMKAVYIVLQVFQYGGSVYVIVMPFGDYFSRHSLSEMTAFKTAVLAFWTVNLVIGMRQVVTISVLLIQHSIFINLHFKNYFVYLKCSLFAVLKKVYRANKSGKRKTIRPIYSAKILHYDGVLSSITIKFLHMQSKAKLLNYMLFLATMITLEFNVFMVADRHSSPFLRTMIFAESPFLLLFVFFNLHLMVDLNAKSKLILPELDGCLHRVCWPRGQGIVRRKFSLAERRTLIARDGVAVNLAEVEQLTRRTLISIFLRMICDIFLLIDVNR